MHVEDQGTGYQAGTSGPGVYLQPRLQVPAQQPSPTREAGHRPAEIQDRHLRQRLLLARTRGLQVFCPAQEQCGVLARKDRKEPGTGQDGAQASR